MNACTLFSAARAIRVALVTSAALAVLCGSAAAQFPPPPGAVAIRWNDCYGDGGANARNFACNTNSGFEELVISCYPPQAIPQLNGAAVVMDLIFMNATVPSWWQFQSGGCHTPNGAFPLFTGPASASNCIDPWLFAASGGIDYVAGFNGANRARLRTVQAIPGSVSVPASSELFVCRVLISNTKTVGAGSCGGCLFGACIGLTSVKLTQPAGVGDFTMVMPVPNTNSDAVGWQAEVYMPSVWELFGKTFTNCQLATAARRPTWGAIKRMYR
jgi:hypothetical protein